MESGGRSAPPSIQGVLGRRHQRRPGFTTARDRQSRRDVGAVLAPKEPEVAVEKAPQADTGSQLLIVEQKGGARGSVSPYDPLIAVNGKQHPRLAILEPRKRA